MRQLQVLCTALQNRLQPVDDIAKGGTVVWLKVPALKHDVVAERNVLLSLILPR